MIFKRLIIKELEIWAKSDTRKPLLLRGARQVGKTTVVREFGKRFTQFITLNLERKEQASLFLNYATIESLVQAIFFVHDKNIQISDTLIFIDEIQEVPEAINLLRYFHEDYPQFKVIAAGSLLETVLSENIKIPVGRLDNLIMRPMNFVEFIEAMEEKTTLDIFNQIPIPTYAHEKLILLFHTYALIGGMPEIVSNYVRKRNLSGLSKIYSSLIISFIEDVEKYANNSSMVQIMRHIISSMNTEAGNRIRFHNFGNSNYRSREVGESLRILEKAYLLQLIYPITKSNLPLIPNKRKSPRLQLLDTGLLNYNLGIQKEIISTPQWDQIHQGRIIEHLIGQELLAIGFEVLKGLHFWTREKNESNAEVDFLYLYEGLVIPIEVKSGLTGRLRSLHLFMDEAPHPYAIRMYSGNIKIDYLKTTTGKIFYLLNLPYYLTYKINEYLNWMVKSV